MSHEELNREMKELLNKKSSWGAVERLRLWELGTSGVVLLVNELVGWREWRSGEESLRDEVEGKMMDVLEGCNGEPMEALKKVLTEARRNQRERERKCRGRQERELEDEKSGGEHITAKAVKGLTSGLPEDLMDFMESRLGVEVKKGDGHIDIMKIGETVGVALGKWPEVEVTKVVWLATESAETQGTRLLGLKLLGSLPEWAQRDVARSLAEAGVKKPDVEYLLGSRRDERLKSAIEQGIRQVANKQHIEN